MRKRFNDGQFWHKVRTGEFTVMIVRDAPLDRSNPRSSFADDPRCARSQIVRYLDANGATAAIVHQYIRDDGEQCARGRPDPKSIVLDGIAYVLCPPTEPRAE
jgi:hypothetical protein